MFKRRQPPAEFKLRSPVYGGPVISNPKIARQKHEKYTDQGTHMRAIHALLFQPGEDSRVMPPVRKCRYKTRLFFYST